MSRQSNGSLKGKARFVAPTTYYLLLTTYITLLTSCDFFSTRSPEPPIVEAGTFVQPDTPDQVVENMRNAVGELNAQNYRRSFSDDLTFRPSPEAEAGNPSIWSGWSVQDEESYFRALASAARLTSGNELRFNEPTLSAVDAARFTFDASYLLTVNHRKPDLPSTLHGRLVWTIVQEEDGLWRISEWTDRSIADGPSWSDLKAAFIQ